MNDRPGNDRSLPRGRGDDGAVLVEFALIAPLLFTLVFGIIEFGWLFAQDLDVRHGVREGARLAAVDYGSGADADARRQEIADEICDRMERASGAEIYFGLMASPTSSPPGPGATGVEPDIGYVRVELDNETLTGFFDPILGNADHDSTVEFRLEQDASWISSSDWNAENKYTCA